MDTNAKAVMVSKRRGPYWHHPLALKWAIVEETLQPGASVAQIARNHGVNTHQVFLWRKSYRKGLLPEPKPTLLPVTLTPQRVSNPLPAVSSSANTGFLTIEIDQVRVRIEGRPDTEMLRLLLAELQR